VTKPEWIREHRISPLFQMTFERDPALPHDTPTLLELVGNDRDRDIVRLLTRVEAIGFFLMGPPEVPADRVEILRKSFAEMVASPDFIADAKTVGIGVDPMSGSDLQQLVGDILATPQDIVSAFKTAASPPR
jgi:tripartite-type tricarboxylate transporter receptor subunit TctC